MFEHSEKARVFALPPGADFPRDFVRGFLDRTAAMAPEAALQIEIYVNTRRMQRRIQSLMAESGARLLPRLRLITELENDPVVADLAPSVSPLRRRLQLSRVVLQLIEKEPGIAPRSAVFDLADSLAALMDEMRGEGVSPDRLRTLDVSRHSQHWERSLKFLNILAPYFTATGDPDREERQRIAVERLCAKWQATPPAHPVLVVGSTGSRGTTFAFMQTVAHLPQGAVVLPGFDDDMPPAQMADLASNPAEDHPQFRFARLVAALSLNPDEVKKWVASQAPAPERNRLVSLSLRPAPVTDQWLEEGSRLDRLDVATAGLTLVEAPDPRAEALAVALRLRKAAEDGVTAALITPDRDLTRRVSAALDRWGIRADDSAGRPLPLTAPGRFLRHVAALFHSRLSAELLLTILKHPLTATGAQSRGAHLRWTRELELSLRRFGPPFPDAASLSSWGLSRGDSSATEWVNWLISALFQPESASHLPLEAHIRRHLAMAEALATGPGGDTSGELWQADAGRLARAVMDEFLAEAPHGGTLGARDYSDMLHGVLGRKELRESVTTHPGIMIWGTLEARVQGADLVVLAGLNDGTWPALPAPDPWLNRQMRADLGLHLPERQIGLSAHDYQQAICAPQVVLSRAVRSADAETVASRWLNRLTNLLGGLEAQGGKAALAAMRERGDALLRLSEALETPGAATASARAPRPSPRPPVSARPKSLSVTAIETLIRDPYAIYARHVLKLKKLDPLRRTADALERGSVLHDILERFIAGGVPEDMAEARRTLLAIADETMTTSVPWAEARILWLARLERVADWFLEREKARMGTPIWLEEKVAVALEQSLFSLTAKPDRIDIEPDGRLHIIDYKTGEPPSEKKQAYFNKQLLLQAAMAPRGGFGPPRETARITYVGLGSPPKEVTTEITPEIEAETWAGLERLIRRYLSPETGFTALRAVFSVDRTGDYDHLARYGEWELADTPKPEDVG